MIWGRFMFHDHTLLLFKDVSIITWQNETDFVWTCCPAWLSLPCKRFLLAYARALYDVAIWMTRMFPLYLNSRVRYIEAHQHVVQLIVFWNEALPVVALHDSDTTWPNGTCFGFHWPRFRPKFQISEIQNMLSVHVSTQITVIMTYLPVLLIQDWFTSILKL